VIRNAAVVICTLVVALCCGVVRADAGGLPTSGRQQDATDATFLGFRDGQEVRYILESDDASREIHAIWGIRLEEFDREGGIFTLTYEAIRGGSPSGQGGQLIRYSTATAWINAYGFPTRVRFTTQRVTSLDDIEYTIDYRYEDERFTKKLEGRSKEQEVGIDYDVVDKNPPSGLYLFMPVDAECVTAARRLWDDPEGNKSIAYRGGNRSRPANMELVCQGREPVFANPGLLNLTMPALWETGTGALEFVAMAPTGIDAFKVIWGASQPGTGGINLGGFNLFDGGPDPFNDGDAAFQMFGITTDSDVMQLDIGGRPVDVWRMKASAPLESAYVDGNGSIARLDLPTDPETGERFWIRRLRPNEY